MWNLIVFIAIAAVVSIVGFGGVVWVANVVLESTPELLGAGIIGASIFFGMILTGVIIAISLDSPVGVHVGKIAESVKKIADSQEKAIEAQKQADNKPSSYGHYL